MSSTNVPSLISKLSEVFSRFAYPHTIVCDNGPPFSAKEFKVFCMDRKIKLLFTAPYNPQSNGLAERSVQSFKKILIKHAMSRESKNLSLSQRLSDCLFTYRSIPSTVTGISPMASMFSFTPRTPLSVVDPSTSSQENENYGKTSTKNNKFAINDNVLVYLKHLKCYSKWVPAVIKLKLSNTMFLVLTKNGDVRKVHVSQLKKSCLKMPNSCFETDHDSELGGRYRIRLPLESSTDHENQSQGENINNENVNQEPMTTSRTSEELGDTQDQIYRTRYGRPVRPPERFPPERFS